MKNPTVSIVVPTLNDCNKLEELLLCLKNQSYLPSEIIIVDSSSNELIYDLVQNIDLPFSVSYFRIGKAFKLDRLYYFFFKMFKQELLFFKLFGKPRAYPYEATNFGVSKSSNQIVAFLDTTTLPIDSWLENHINFFNQGYEVVFGFTRYHSTSFKQELIHFSCWGHSNIETMPGTIIETKNYLNGLLINEGVRAGGDIDWRHRAKERHSYYLPKYFSVSYKSIPDSIFSSIKKSFIYQIHSAISDIQSNVRSAYFLIILLFSFLLVPKWNALVGWESSPLFIPHITKIYLITFLVFCLMIFILNQKKIKSIFNKKGLSRTLLIVLIGISFAVVYNWNGLIAQWVEDSVWFVPNITKIYLLLLLSISFLYRALIVPLRSGVSPKDIFPIKFVAIGAVGLLLDLAKTPGYVMGAIYTFLKNLKNHFSFSSKG